MKEYVLEYIKSVNEVKGNVGVFAVGHCEYWPQFKDLKDKLMKHFDYFCNELNKINNANIIKVEYMCDRYETAFQAGSFLATKQLDLIICFIATYSPAVNATTVIQKVGRNIPILLVVLQPTAGLDYSKGTTEMQLENDNITSLPEIVNSLIRMNKKSLDCIVGMLYEDGRAWNKIKLWCEVATVLRKLKQDQIGLMGHVYEGMQDMNSDPTMVERQFGMHVRHIEMEDLELFLDKVTEPEIEEKVKEIKEIFDFPDPVSDPITSKVEESDLRWPAMVSVAMDELIYNFKLTGLAYYYRGLNNNKFEQMHAGMIIGNSLLTSNGIAIAGEFDLKTCVAMLITHRFGAGGSFAEIHPIDFREDFVLVGHDGPHHLEIADGKPVLRKLSVLHGKRGRGPSVEYKLKTGPITLFGLTQTYDGKFKMVVAEGESLPGKVPPTGNTNTRAKFNLDVRNFLEKWSIEGPTHHFALGVGHIANKLELLARCLEMEFVLVTSGEKSK